MKIRLGLAAVAAAAGAALVTGAAPAFASGPPAPPAGCTFDQATGVETCVTTTTTAGTIGPLSTDGLLPASTTTDGFTGTQYCSAPTTYFYELSNAVYGVTITTTTTTERHGLNGKVFNTSTSTSQSLPVYESGYLFCEYG